MGYTPCLFHSAQSRSYCRGVMINYKNLFKNNDIVKHLNELKQLRYNFTTCHPNKAEVVKYDEVRSGTEILQLFKEYPWNNELSILSQMKESEIQYSPSLEIIETSKQFGGIVFSAVGKAIDYKFLVFYNGKKSSAESGEVDNLEALKLLQLYLSNRIDELIKEIHKTRLTQNESALEEDHRSIPKWLMIVLNLILIGIFMGLTAIGILTESWQISTLFGSIAIFYTVAFIYFSKKT